MMRFLVWNVRGIASQASFQRLHVLLRKHKPLILCLLEPFCVFSRLDSFRLRLGFDYAFAGANVKLWLFWNSDLTLNFESESDQSVSVSCIYASIPTAFWISFVYAKTKERLRDPLWAELYSVSDKVPIGVPCTCDLIDSSAYGSSFTWWNGRRKESAIWMRLDRFLYTSAWELIFKTSVQHLSRTSSDHCPLLVTSQALSVQHISKHFIFLNVWTKHEDFLRVVKESWDVPIDGALCTFLATKLSRLKKVLTPWNKETFGNIFSKLQELEDERYCSWRGYCNKTPMMKELSLTIKKSVALLQKQISIEEEYWKQKSHRMNVQEGDRNSKFFHSLVKERRRKLYIHK
nr:uncharacterized protein LOC109164037 [Ipomoea batatas]